MKRRRFLLAAGVVAFGGCSSDRDAATGSEDPAARTEPTTHETVREEARTPATSGETPGTSGETQEPTTRGASESSLATAREHLATAFDELRAMRPVGPERIRASEARFDASDHGTVRDRVAAAETALERAGTASEESAGAVEALRVAAELARSGRALYGAVRRGYRAEWRFERRCFGAEWIDARDRAREAADAVEAWERHGRAVTDAVEALEAAGPASVPRLSPAAWHRDGAVLGGVAGPLVDVLRGFGGYAEAVRLDEDGLEAMRAGAYRDAGDRFASAAETVRGAHRRLARARADGAQGFTSYAVPIRRRCEPFRKAYATQVEASRAADAGESDRAETLERRAMDRIVAAELEHPLPKPEGGTPKDGSG